MLSYDEIKPSRTPPRACRRYRENTAPSGEVLGFFLGTRPNRSEFTFTPKHGYWLNPIESFFGKDFAELAAVASGELE